MPANAATFVAQQTISPGSRPCVDSGRTMEFDGDAQAYMLGLYLDKEIYEKEHNSGSWL
jgi:hypothetical protein